MSAQPLLPPLSPPAPGRSARVEYLDFQNVAEHREFRLRVYSLDGSTEVRFRIPITAFGAGRVRLQDGPDVCYQKLLRTIAAGETMGPEVVTIGDVDLARYRETHTQAPKHRSWSPSSPSSPPTLTVEPENQPRKPRRPLPLAPLVRNDATSALEEGQRVSHAVFGLGVTISSSADHTVVRFDEDEPKTFVTSMLEVDVLSAPRTWETSARGKNRPCRPLLAAS